MSARRRDDGVLLTHVYGDGSSGFRAFACPTCQRRGWVVSGADAWPEECRSCRGKGEISVYRLTKHILGCREVTLARLRNLRCRPATGARILDSLAAHFDLGGAS